MKARTLPGHESPHTLLQILGMSAADDGLDVVAQVFELRDDLLGWARAKRSSGEKQGGSVWIQSIALTRPRAIDPCAKNGINRNTGNGDAMSRKSKRLEMRFCLVERNEVAMKGS